MHNVGSLVGRLTIMYAITLSLSLIVMFVVMMKAFDWFGLAELDRKLVQTAHRVASSATFAGSRFVPHRGEDRQLAELLAASGLSGALFTLDGRRVEGLGSVSAAVRAIVGAHPRKAALLSLGARNDRLRLALHPIVIAARLRGEAVVWQREDGDGALDNDVLLLFALTAPLIVLTCLLIGGAIARRGLEPLEAMTRIASNIEATDISARLRVGTQRDQLSRLAAAFNRMLDRLGEAFSRERRFTSDASHELRAPLAVIRATAEHALATAAGVPEQQALRTIILEVDELEELTRDLLSAARGEIDTRAGGRADFAEVAVRVTDELFPLARARNLRLRVAVVEHAVVDVEETVLVRVVRAIVHNALNFARCDIFIDVTTDGLSAEVHVSDDGPGFSPAALLHGTERFWRGDESRGREQGTGLGLAIVRDLVASSTGTLTLSNRAEGGARVSVQFLLSEPALAVPGRSVAGSSDDFTS